MVLAPIIQKEDGLLDFTKTAVELERRMRAFTPWPGAFTGIHGARLKVHRVKVGSGHGAPGTVLAASPGGIEVACGEGSIVLLDVQPEGKRVMAAGEFLAGHKLMPGSQPFAAPVESKS
jgi:methionyl-tRNA formyltransferase